MIEIFFCDLQSLFKLSEKTVSSLKKIGILNLRDLLFYLPYSHQFKIINPDLSKIQEGQIIQTEIIIVDISSNSNRVKNLKILGKNDYGYILLVFFNPIPSFIFNRLIIGSQHVVTGKVQNYDGVMQLNHPEFIINHSCISAYEPIYHLTYGVTNKQLYSYVVKGLELIEKVLLYLSLQDNYPLFQYIHGLMEELFILHLYKINQEQHNLDDLWACARSKLAEKELIINQILLSTINKTRNIKNDRQILKAKILQEKILNKLTFNLTSGQLKVIQEIEKDQVSKLQMMRLLQGDVGAGKTLVALLTILNITSIGAQSALLAPTDLLANQHFNFFKKALADENISIELLTGKTTAKEKKRIKASLELGGVSILIGTHALLQEDVIFNDIAYIVIDEQHKFGVQQRQLLINKASHPDILMMTATPIPRSLTLTVFGDMDVSNLTSKPSNRLPIVTIKCSNRNINDVIKSLAKKIAVGENIFWVCPLIENKEEERTTIKRDLSNVIKRFEILDEFYPKMVGILHGKMSADQKDKTMEEFKQGKLQILVTTTVIEVGIDIPSATLMVIEDAEMFGLAQLHQLRGRIGRSELLSHCILLYNPCRLSPEAKARLEIMKNSNDGFYIAEQDMLLRGSGELLGTKQSGLPEFFFADLTKDIKILEKAKDEVEQTQKDPNIKFMVKLFTKNCDSLTKIIC